MTELEKAYIAGIVDQDKRMKIYNYISKTTKKLNFHNFTYIVSWI